MRLQPPLRACASTPACPTMSRALALRPSGMFAQAKLYQDVTVKTTDLCDEAKAHVTGKRSLVKVEEEEEEGGSLTRCVRP